jgi:hypothetical protein
VVSSWFGAYRNRVPYRDDRIAVQGMFKLIISVIVQVGVLVATVGHWQIDIKKARLRAFTRHKAQRISVILGNRFLRFAFKIELIVKHCQKFAPTRPRRDD